MKYKGTFEPQYVLGKSSISFTERAKSDCADPESLTWDLLDDDLRKRFDERPFVSLSQDRALAEKTDTADLPDGKAANVRLDPADLKADGTEVSLFSFHMPGVLTREQVEAEIDLDHLKLLAQGSVVEMSVSQMFRIVLPTNQDNGRN